MITINQIYNMDCQAGMKAMIENNIKADLIVTDPPYLIKGIHGGKSQLGLSVQRSQQELVDCKITDGISNDMLNLMWDVVKKPNFYFFCNRAQIQQYLDFFVTRNKCKWEMLIWHKTNVPPLYHNTYLCDKEYILHFRKGTICNPATYEKAKTVFTSGTNVKDKKLHGHPTVKPLNIVSTLIENSSAVGDLILDPFMGSGTTAVAAKELNRNYIGFEINESFFNSSQKRINDLIRRN